MTTANFIGVFDDLIKHCEEERTKAVDEASLLLIRALLSNDRHDIASASVATGKALAYADMIDYLKGE